MTGNLPESLRDRGRRLLSTAAAMLDRAAEQTRRAAAALAPDDDGGHDDGGPGRTVADVWQPEPPPATPEAAGDTPGNAPVTATPDAPGVAPSAGATQAGEAHAGETSAGETQAAAPAAEPPVPTADIDELAESTVAEITPRIPELTDAELRLLYQREQEGKQRKTVLAAVERALAPDEP